MHKHLLAMFTMIFIISCGDNEIANQAPSFGFQKDRIVRVNEGSTDIGNFQATDADGDEIIYSISNLDMSITQDGLVTFNIIPDFEIESVYSATIVASNSKPVSYKEKQITKMESKMDLRKNTLKTVN